MWFAFIGPDTSMTSGTAYTNQTQKTTKSSSFQAKKPPKTQRNRSGRKGHRPITLKFFRIQISQKAEDLPPGGSRRNKLNIDYWLDVGLRLKTKWVGVISWLDCSAPATFGAFQFSGSGVDSGPGERPSTLRPNCPVSSPLRRLCA